MKEERLTICVPNRIHQTGRHGVIWVDKGRCFSVSARVFGKLTRLYWGPDLFEACCVRAAFEIRRERSKHYCKS